eukprot:gnl/Dysnectes_brevis/2591_a3128_676.p1 GENE.gnl/Dysnectes_brevis/2591_a3128_676~~gnl/Dysnectes_brevis/2591_a3128_676.p1  ORF type:complete len:712 (-),score=215.86 gnl/Dysnectes_brevis/2591_a3128_676:29-2164(-)
MAETRQSSDLPEVSGSVEAQRGTGITLDDTAIDAPSATSPTPAVILNDAAIPPTPPTLSPEDTPLSPIFDVQKTDVWAIILAVLLLPFLFFRNLEPSFTMLVDDLKLISVDEYETSKFVPIVTDLTLRFYDQSFILPHLIIPYHRNDTAHLAAMALTGIQREMVLNQRMSTAGYTNVYIPAAPENPRFLSEYSDDEITTGAWSEDVYVHRVDLGMAGRPRAMAEGRTQPLASNAGDTSGPSGGPRPKKLAVVTDQLELSLLSRETLEPLWTADLREPLSQWLDDALYLSNYRLVVSPPPPRAHPAHPGLVCLAVTLEAEQGEGYVLLSTADADTGEVLWATRVQMPTVDGDLTDGEYPRFIGVSDQHLNSVDPQQATSWLRQVSQQAPPMAHGFSQSLDTMVLAPQTRSSDRFIGEEEWLGLPDGLLYRTTTGRGHATVLLDLSTGKELCAWVIPDSGVLMAGDPTTTSEIPQVMYLSWGKKVASQANFFELGSGGPVLTASTPLSESTGVKAHFYKPGYIPPPMYHPIASPVSFRTAPGIHGSRVLALGPGGFLYCLDGATRVLWRSPLEDFIPSSETYLSATVAAPGLWIALVELGDRLYAFNAATGSPLMLADLPPANTVVCEDCGSPYEDDQRLRLDRHVTFAPLHPFDSAKQALMVTVGPLLDVYGLQPGRGAVQGYWERLGLLTFSGLVLAGLLRRLPELRGKDL